MREAGGVSALVRTKPSTKLGWWAVWLSVTFAVLAVVNATVFRPSTVAAPWRQVLLPFYGIAMMSSGLAAGIVGLVAVTRRHERSLLVWLPLVAGALVAFFLLGEFLAPH